MASPISARLPLVLRQKLAKYCAAGGITQTEAIARGIELLLKQPARAPKRSPEDIMRSLERLRASIRTRVTAKELRAWQIEGRD